MEKYIECKDCQNQYDCERTYLGGCTDGKEWEDDKDINVRSKTEEKKLTDEEIVKALACCTQNPACDKCPIRDIDYCEKPDTFFC